jgi:hypothetical protein
MGVEISNPVAVDRALGKHLGNCPWQSRLVGLQEFNNRLVEKKIYYGESEKPESFLENLAASLPENLQLPVVSFFRELDFAQDQDETGVSSFSLSNTEDTRHYEIEYTNYLFKYSITVIGHGSASLHEVAIPLHHYLAKNPVVNVPYRLFHDKIENRAVKFNLPATIKNPWQVAFKDVTPRKDNLTQVFAINGRFEVKVPMIWMEQVTPIVEDIVFMPMIVSKN